MNSQKEVLRCFTVLGKWWPECWLLYKEASGDMSEPLAYYIVIVVVVIY